MNAADVAKLWATGETADGLRLLAEDYLRLREALERIEVFTPDETQTYSSDADVYQAIAAEAKNIARTALNHGKETEG